MIHSRLIELQIQHEKEERERHLRKRMAQREASAPVPGQPHGRQSGLSGQWQLVKDQVRHYWGMAMQTPLSIQKLVRHNVSEQR